MGRVGKWVARRGAVGSTARWAAKAYRHYRTLHPDRATVPDTEIHRLMIEARYKVLDKPAQKEALLKAVARDEGLENVVLMILVYEADLPTDMPDFLNETMDVVEEELEKAGMTDKEITG